MLSTRSFRFRKVRNWCAPMALLLAVYSPGHAETLKEALAAAYLYNPTLKSARAQLRSADNGVSLAKSGYRPTVSATYQEGWDDLRTKLRSLAIPPGSLPFCPGTLADSTTATCSQSFQPLPLSTLTSSQIGNGQSNPRMGQITLQETLFDGFRTYNNVKGAEALVEASPGSSQRRNKHASERGDGLHECGARCGHRRAAPK